MSYDSKKISTIHGLSCYVPHDLFSVGKRLHVFNNYEEISKNILHPYCSVKNMSQLFPPKHVVRGD